MKRTAETAIYKVLQESDGQPDRILCKNLRRAMPVWREEFDYDDITKELADLYPFFEASDSVMLKSYLYQFHEKHNGSHIIKSLCDKFENDGVLVFQKNNNVFVVHGNNKSYSREDKPIQVSRWALDMGVIGDSIHSSVEEALRSDRLFHERLVNEDELEILQERMVNPESKHQERRKELTGSYCLS